jgi:tetratricopeptide (TPR) repeat protein
MSLAFALDLMQARACRVGVQPVERVFLIENHDEAYYIWRNAKVAKRTLVHIDAHHDMWWVNDERTIEIGNFICLALKEDLIQEVFWVVPDGAFQDAKSRRSVLQHLRIIQRTYPGSSSIAVEEHRMSAAILEKKLTVCPLEFVRGLQGAVLLDIDVDYMMIPKVSYGRVDRHSSLPWCWPNELISRMRGASIWSDLVTVAFSAEGGYTPLQWKYLGQELVQRLMEPLGTGSNMTGMCHLRKGAEAEERGQVVIAESEYRSAQELLPKSAAVRHRLTRLLVRLGRIEEARESYRQAAELDRSYQGPYASNGFHCFWSGDLASAEEEFRALSILDPTDAYCQIGLGLLAQKQKRWNEAEQHLKTALAVNDQLLDAQRAMGDVLAKLGRSSEAILAWEQALKLGLKGHKPVGGPIFTHTRPLSDPWHFATYARLARAYVHQGATQKAIDGLRISIAGGWDNASLRLQLARLYWRQGKWRDVATQCWQAMKIAPKDIYLTARRHFQRAAQFGERWFEA